MTPRSLRFRLLVAAGVAVAIALLIAGMSLTVIFEHHVERRIGAELDNHLKQIVAGIGIDADGRITSNAMPADPRFDQPLGGLYWQIQDEERPRRLRSRSLWDAAIELPADELATGTVHEHVLPGPGGQTLLARERQIIVQPAVHDRRVRTVVAIDRRTLADARNAFAADMLPYLAVMAAVLFIAVWVQVRIGLAPLDSVRRGLTEIRSGAARRLEPVHPEEVMPLVDEINGLLDTQEKAIERARTWTADLAHGLKTPLMVLTADSQRLREGGNTAIADDLDQLADTMRRRVDRELIRARVRSGIRTRHAHADACDAVDRVVRTLKRTPRGAVLVWRIGTPGPAQTAVQGDDLTELLGNVLENATKWASEKVSVTVTADNGVIITVEDDGPGVPADQRDSLGLRGLRLDEQKRGTGLGLAIARDIVEAYRGDLTFGHSPMGGLAVTVRLPAA